MTSSIVILGDGHLGRAVADAAGSRGLTVEIVGRPVGVRHRSERLADADVVVDASRAGAVLDNVEVSLAAGVRRLVIATTGWASDRRAADDAMRASHAAGVASPNFSLGVALFGRLVERASELFGAVDGYEPFLLEWHRRAKADRPSGTAIDLAARMVAHHPRLVDTADFETVSLRAGASPGMHLVGFDAPGETVELRLTARDRSAYAAGIVASIDWLSRERRAPGLHTFDTVVDELLVGPAVAA